MLMGLVEPLNKRILEVDRDLTKLTLEKLYLLRTRDRILKQCSKPQIKLQQQIKKTERDELGDLLGGALVEDAAQDCEMEF